MAIFERALSFFEYRKESYPSPVECTVACKNGILVLQESIKIHIIHRMSLCLLRSYESSGILEFASARVEC